MILHDIEYYQKQKREFALSKCYYAGHENWGEIYGYDLPPPYSKQEILDYENKYDLELPKFIKKYLTTISRENMFGRYPFIIKLDEPYEFYELLGDSYEPPAYIKSINESLKGSYFIQYNERGCSDSDYLCVKGPFYGRFGSYRFGGDYFDIN
jgi:hypothetical protein